VARRQLEVESPAGIHDGQRIRVRGAGHAPARGGERGDAYVAVRVRPHALFVREGDDLHTSVRVPMTAAALGTSVRVPALAGALDIDIPAGAQPGEVRALRGEGMPSLHGQRRGDLYVRLDVAVPSRLNDEQRELLEEFDRRTDEDAYVSDDEDEGFFRRLRSALR
jgi:molecular chaperone DnaJ